MNNDAVFKFGCILPREVWRTPHIGMLIDAALTTSPALIADSMIITCVWRPATERFSYHPGCRAIDIRTSLVERDGEVVGWTDRTGAIVCGNDSWMGYIGSLDWANRIRAYAPPYVDVVYGLDVHHVDHIHLEVDGKKEEEWFYDG